MSIKNEILEFAENNRKFTVADFLNAGENKVSRQYVSRLVSELVREKKLSKAGSTRQSIYSLPKNIKAFGNLIEIKIKNSSVQEHKVLELIQSRAPFIFQLKDNVRSIFDYAFSEMLNNAIEHSKSKYIEIEVSKKNHLLVFEVRDFGIGVFRNVKNQRKLESELEAAEDLLKGKTTTAPKAHSGEGIFFTSKIADQFMLESFGYTLVVNEEINDIFFGQSDTKIRGTRVIFKIELSSTKHLIDIFQKFQTDKESYGFDKTEIQIKLYTTGTIHISRSQAKRVLAGLEKFKTIILDFDKVPMIGQAFADEIFRVFYNRHPEIKIIPINMNEAVAFMIGRVEK